MLNAVQRAKLIEGMKALVMEFGAAEVVEALRDGVEVAADTGGASARTLRRAVISLTNAKQALDEAALLTEDGCDVAGGFEILSDFADEAAGDEAGRGPNPMVAR